MENTEKKLLKFTLTKVVKQVQGNVMGEIEETSLAAVSTDYRTFENYLIKAI